MTGNRHIYMKKPLVFRQECVIQCAAVYKENPANPEEREVDWDAANNVMRKWLEKYNKHHPKEDEIKLSKGTWYLKCYWGEFMRQGSVADLPKDPKHSLIPQVEALKAAQRLKQGDVNTIKVAGEEFTYHCWFTSIEQACKRVPELDAYCVKYKITPAQLLTAMKKADNTLVYRRIFYKHQLTAAQMQERCGFATRMITQLAHEPRLCINTIHIDEAQIVINDKTRSDVHAWCDKHDLSFTDVCPIPLPQGQEIAVKWICAVSAHEAFADKGGLVYLEFTTGTTDIHRRQCTKLDGSQRDFSFSYTVSDHDSQNLWLPYRSMSKQQLGCSSHKARA